MGLFMLTVKKNKMKSYHLMVPAVILSAGVIVTGKIAVSELGPFTILFFRFLIASIVLIPVVLNSKKKTCFKVKDLPILTIAGLIGFFTYNLLIIMALKHTSASNIAIIGSLIPAITLLLEGIFLKTPYSCQKVIGIFVSIIAVLITITDGHIGTFLEMKWNYGDFLMLIGVLCISLYSIINTKIPKNYMSSQILLYYFFVTLCVVLPFFLFEISSKSYKLVTWKGIMIVIYHGIFGSTLTYILIQYSLGKYGASSTMIYMNLVPIFSLVLAIVFLNESFKISLMVSAALICISIYLNKRSSNTYSH